MPPTSGADLVTAPGTSSDTPKTNAARLLLGVVLGATTLVVVMLCAFALPAAKGGPHDVPLGLAGPQQVVQAVQGRLPGDAWDVRAYPDPRALRDAVERREVLGGLAVGADGVTVYTAGAGGQQVSAAITALGTMTAAQRQAEVTVRDLVPFPAGDPRGAGFTASALPMIIGGVLPVVLLLRVFPGHAGLRRRLAGAVLFALVAGAAVAAVLQYGLGSLEGDYPLTALSLSLGMAALSIPLLALETLFGTAGLGLGVAVTMLLGNPLSGMAGPHWLPSGWAALGRLLPPGASGGLVRANAFFGGAGAGGPALTLAAWVLAGLLVVLLAGRRTTRGARAGTAAAAAG